MASPIQVTFDCNDIEKMVQFWMLALNYRMPDPPPGYTDWNEFAAKNNIPKEEWAMTLFDPAGKGPDVYFQLVPEGKTAKNRLHLDIRVSSGFGTDPAERRQQTSARVAELVAAGASILYEINESEAYWVTMADPEGNEFCII